MTSPTLTVPLAGLAALLAAMTLKHYAADFVLQTNWVARGKERADGWAAPLAAHAGTHAAVTLLIAVMVRPGLWWLAFVDLAVHALIDRGKTLVSQRARWPVSDERFWWLMGFDQFLHQLTNIGLVAALFAL